MRYPDMPTEHETEPIVVDTFVALDLDRTGIFTDEYIKILCLQLIDHGVSPDETKQDYEFIMGHNGASFQALDYLEQKYGEEIIQSVKDEVEEVVKTGDLDDDLLPPGTKEFMDHLDTHGVPFAVLTYSTSTTNQRYKLGLYAEMTGRPDLQSEITTTSQKGVSITSDWYDEESGTFTVPFTLNGRLIVARTVVIVDDKRFNLESSNHSVTGVWIDNSDTPAEGAISMLDLSIALASGQAIQDIAQRYEPMTN